MRITPRPHWTPAYFARKLQLAAFQRRHPDTPWLTPDMIRFLDEWLRPTDLFVEFGSGRSTLWFARRVGRIISVESNAQWHGKVVEMIAAQGLTNISYHHTPEAFDGMIRPIEAALDARADAVLVDGGERDRAALWAVDRVKPGGAIIIDNVNWYLPHATTSPSSVGEHGEPAGPTWREFLARVQGWRRYWTSNGVWDTVAYFAPAAPTQPGATQAP